MMQLDKLKKGKPRVVMEIFSPLAALQGNMVVRETVLILVHNACNSIVPTEPATYV